jgi:hypothetical protein
VTGYALDISGRLVEGVITPRRQALRAYEARVRRGIDPGVAEVSRANVFSTRVFPIFPGAGRTVRLSFATPLEAGQAFNLPLATREAVGDVQIRVRTGGTEAATVAGPGLELRPSGAEGGRLWEGRATNRTLAGALRVGPVAPAAPLTVTRHASGEFFVDLVDAAPAASGPAASVRRLRVYWDRSRSRRDDDLNAEIGLLGRYLAATRPEAMDLVTFADDGPRTQSFARPAAGAVEAALRETQYAGATSLAGVLAPSPAPADACLFFSDGTVTVDPYSVGAAPCPLLVVSSAPDADRGLLTALATTSGGEYVDLRATSADAALARLSARGARVVAATDEAGADLRPAALPAAPGRVRVIARAPDDGGAVVVRFADGSRRTYRRRPPGPRAMTPPARCGPPPASPS